MTQFVKAEFEECLRLTFLFQGLQRVVGLVLGRFVLTAAVSALLVLTDLVLFDLVLIGLVLLLLVLLLLVLLHLGVAGRGGCHG